MPLEDILAEMLGGSRPGYTGNPNAGTDVPVDELAQIANAQTVTTPIPATAAAPAEVPTPVSPYAAYRGAPAQAPDPAAAPGALSQVTPLAMALLRGYLTAIQSPKRKGVSGAVGSGGLAALDAWQQGAYLQHKSQLENAVMEHQLASARAAEATARKTGLSRWRLPDGTIKAFDPAADIPPGSEQLDPSVEAARVAKSGKEGPKFSFKESFDPTAGTNEIKSVGIDEKNGQMYEPGPDGKPVPISGIRGKADANTISGLSAITQARGVGKAALEGLADLKAQGKDVSVPGAWLAAGGYKAGFAGPETEVRDKMMFNLDNTKQQLMAAAQKAAGTRNFQYVKIIQDHFPDKWKGDPANEQRLHLFFDKGGVIDRMDNSLRYGNPATDKEDFPNYDGTLESLLAAPAAAGTSTGAAAPITAIQTGIGTIKRIK